MSEQVVGKRQFGHKARLVLPAVLSFKIDEQAHAARAMWNLLHAWWLMMPGEKLHGCPAPELPGCPAH
ncbi:hypothetical protein ACIA8E_25810 [Streptomyces sp. NPDC051664]|uniref:hypothetical protein n=1 Tax=Streptomyces sp. NPDC051664 TaxID=3365668 RepID=UPI0037B590F7